MGKSSVCCGTEIKAKFPSQEDAVPSHIIQSQFPNKGHKYIYSEYIFRLYE